MPSASSASSVSLLLALVMALRTGMACAALHPGASSAIDIDALIAGDRCSTADKPLPPAQPTHSDPVGGTDDPGSGCMHFTAGDCHGTGPPVVGGWWAALDPVAVAALGPTAPRGKTGAPLWRSGHPVRGPPRATL